MSEKLGQLRAEEEIVSSCLHLTGGLGRKACALLKERLDVFKSKCPHGIDNAELLKIMIPIPSDEPQTWKGSGTLK